MLKTYSKKISWTLLILLFTFDDVVSFFAVTKMHGKEANLFIAPYVEKYPLLYFFAILVTILIIFLIEKLITKIAGRLFKKWGIGNSLPNLIFLLGFRISFQTVWVMNNLAILPAVIYAYITIQNNKN